MMLAGRARELGETRRLGCGGGLSSLACFEEKSGMRYSRTMRAISSAEISWLRLFFSFWLRR
jgi:hypothetical protein